MRDLVSKTKMQLSAKVDNRTRILRGPTFAPTKVHFVKPAATRKLNATSKRISPNRTPRPRVNVPLPPVPAQQRIHSLVSPPVKHITTSGPQAKTMPLYNSKGKLLGDATVLLVRHSNLTKAGASRYKVEIKGKCAGWATMTSSRLVLLGSK